MTMIAEAPAIVPDRGIRPGFNETGTDIPARRFVVRAAGSDLDSVTLPLAGGYAHGVSMNVLKNTYRGDVQVDGVALVTASATVARGDRVMVDTAGKVLKATSTHYVVGECVSGGGNGDDISVELRPLAGIEP